jgi:hypothetical protein
MGHSAFDVNKAITTELSQKLVSNIATMGEEK